MRVQADMVDGLHVTIAEKEKFHQAIWAGCERVSVKFGDHPDKLHTGFSELVATDPTLSRERSQFRIARVAGRVVQEKVSHRPAQATPDLLCSLLNLFSQHRFARSHCSLSFGARGTWLSSLSSACLLVHFLDRSLGSLYVAI
jgi:hypothetical protein